MDTQQGIALMVVAGAAFYLARSTWRSWQAFRSGKAGCGTGCGNCGRATIQTKPPRKDIIPLSEIRKRSG